MNSPYAADMSIVIKIGGSTFGSGDTTLEDLVSLQGKKVPVVVVHGGGKEITSWLERLGVQSRFVRGLRVTDTQSLQVVVAVLAGLVNKELVAKLNSLGGEALGLCGSDGCLLEAKVSDPELGLVGEVTRVNTAPLLLALNAGYIPVVAPIGWDRAGGGLLNINGDTAAGHIAAALRAERLIFLTDVPGILDASGNLLPRLSRERARELTASGVISGGMLPKIEACWRSGTAARIIDGRQPHALLRELEGTMAGTTVEGEA